MLILSGGLLAAIDILLAPTITAAPSIARRMPAVTSYPTDRNDRSAPPISAAIICLNEEHNISCCLDALSWCDEIVVVDSGSTDRTLQIVERFNGTKVLYRRFDTYIAQKNFALDHCQHDWVLSVDADEILPGKLIEEIQGLSFDVAGYFVGRRSFLGDQEIKYGSWNPDYKLRLFRRSVGRWGGSNPHERVLLEGPTQRLTTRMLHYSYRTRQEFLDRNRKYMRMLVEHQSRPDKRTYLGEPILHGWGNFVKSYILRRGFLDGPAGLYIAYHMARLSYEKHSLLARKTKEFQTSPMRRSA